IGEAVLEKLAERGTEAVIEWCRDHASTPLTPEDEAHLRQALAEDGSFLTILKSQMHFADRRGIALVGPSGAGKTALATFLAEGEAALAPAFTMKRHYDFT